MGAWSAERFERWYREQPVVPERDYQETLVPRIRSLDKREGFSVEKYGEAAYETLNRETGHISKVLHDLYCILVGNFNPDKPTGIVIGGTHGYEKGGPLAALGFAEEEAASYAEKINIIIYPCLCPGPYEKELRFTEGRIDPNRDAFLDEAKSQEMKALARSLKDLHARMFGKDLRRSFAVAIDLHETPKKDLEINRENAEAGEERFVLDDFPEGLFLIAFDKDQDFAQDILMSARNEGHRIVSDETIYGIPNHGGILLMSEMGPTTGRVRQLTAHYTRANFTTEFCGMNISDAMPDAERAAPQRAAIRGMLHRL